MREATPISPTAKGIWSQEEHDRFLDAMKLYPKGPWRIVADHVGTRSVRQVQTHAQKYQEKVSRRLRGLRKCKKRLVRPEHRIDEDTMELCKLVACTVQQLVVTGDDNASLGAMSVEPMALSEEDVATPEVLGTIDSPRGTDTKIRTDDLLPLPCAEVVDEIELDPLAIPTVSESLDFLIEYLST
ncbi:unnamed protein product [Hyaloperonospora brassicae]|uniref:HTH myb-type domain-containing protein n=1 Tax=Hyaloperonospora brassicae TaxID=162125 RepID=A0AAV0UXW8_HYABA|nr:unnamed protein product [Hyaloperonospora brassicae]